MLQFNDLYLLQSFLMWSSVPYSRWHSRRRWVLWDCHHRNQLYL